MRSEQRSIAALVVFTVLLCARPFVQAQQPALTGISTTGVWLRQGPHVSYPYDTGIYEDTPVTIEWRNQIGNWLYVRSADDPTREGWTMTGFVEMGALSVMDIPVMLTPDANPEAAQNADSPDLQLLYATPVFGGVSPTMLDIFLRGQANGRDATAVAKIGDCNTASELFLIPISSGAVDFGPYSYLIETASIFSTSFGRDSLAARDGFNTASVFDPMWSNAEVCNSGEDPITCELRVSNASVAMIVFGQNDIHALNRDQFAGRLRALVEASFDLGIIPIFSTFTNSPENSANWGQILAFNAIIVRVAADYNIPLINLWLAARSLPGYGIGEDFAHLTAGGDVLRFTGSEAQHGMTLYNLLTLYALDQVRRQVMMG